MLVCFAFYVFFVDFVFAASYDLSPSLRSGETRRVKIVVSVQGKLKLNSDGQQVQQVPLKVSGELQYDEQILEASGEAAGRLQAARFYRAASADIQIGETKLSSQLHADRRLIGVLSTPQGPAIFSPLGPLTRDEVDLIDVQANSVLLPVLLPDQSKRITIDTSWTPQASSLAPFLGLDVVSQSDVRCRLRDVQDRLAIVELTGTVSGAVGGVATELELKAKYNFDLDQRQITWLALDLKENRSIGHAEPGFEVVAQLRLTAGPATNSPQLSDPVISRFQPDDNEGSLLLSFSSAEGGFRLLLDRRWRIMVDRRELTIMRLIDKGDLVAQCNISALDDLPAGEQLKLEALQRDIQQSLGEHFGQFVEAGQNIGENGLRVLRVVVNGQVSELPITWVYYHLSDDTGRRVSLVFTMESRLLEQFGATDQLLVSSLQLMERPEPVMAADVEATSAASRN